MSYGGHVADMISRFSYNRSQLNSHKDRIAHIKQQYKDVLTRSGKLNVREIPFEELEEIKAAIRLKMKRRKQTMVWLYIFAAAIIVCLTASFVYNML